MIPRVLLALLACTGDAAAPATTDPCAPYAANESLRAACVTRVVLDVTDQAAATALCDTLPPDANAACRTRWVSEASKNAALEGGDLLQACNGVPDCAFVVLESRIAPTYEEQVLRCDYWAGKYAADCVGHAAQRLLNTHPDDDTLRAAAMGIHGERIAGMIPGYLRCSGRQTCPDLGPMTATCEASNAHLPPNAGCCCDGGPLGTLHSAQNQNPGSP